MALLRKNQLCSVHSWIQLINCRRRKTSWVSSRTCSSVSSCSSSRSSPPSTRRSKIHCSPGLSWPTAASSRTNSRGLSAERPNSKSTKTSKTSNWPKTIRLHYIRCTWSTRTRVKAMRKLSGIWFPGRSIRLVGAQPETWKGFV